MYTCTGCCEQNGTIGIDHHISDASDSDMCCLSSSATGSTIRTLNKGLNKLSSPVWLSARNKLRKFAFQKLDTKRKQGATKSDTNQKDKQADIGSASMKDGKLLSRVQVSTLTLFSMFVDIDVSLANSPSPPSDFPSLPSLLLPQTQVPLSPKERSESVQVETESGDDTPTEDDEDSLSESEDDYSDKQKEVIMEFLNNSSQEELCDIPGCSMSKAKLLAQHLPIDKWEDLVSQGRIQGGGWGGGALGAQAPPSS